MANEQIKTPECLDCLWPFLRLSRIFGICPVSRNGNQLSTRNSVWWFSTILSLTIELIFITKIIRDIWHSTTTPDQLAFQFYFLIYYLQTCGNCLFSIWKARCIPKFLEACTKIEVICWKYKEPKETLIRNCTLLYLFFTVMIIYANIFYYLAEGKYLIFS